jgi:ubiquinone/menaquinone biosynthesis C-methylase UbiE
MGFTRFVLHHLPPPPIRVLEVGCGEEGGVAPALVDAGYDVLAIDPHAPDGPPFRQISLEELEEPERFDAVVAGRVLHHVQPLDDALDKLVRLAPLLVVDEFAPEKLRGATQEWYEAQYRVLTAAGRDRRAPADLDEWRRRHSDLHPSDVLLAALAARYDHGAGTTVMDWEYLLLTARRSGSTA